MVRSRVCLALDRGRSVASLGASLSSTVESPPPSTEIALRLECSDQVISNKNDGEGITERCVSPDIQKILMQKYDEWIEVEPKLHRTFSYPPANLPLKFNKVMKILNDVLGVVADASFSRGDERKQVNHATFSVFVYRESEYFTRCTPPDAVGFLPPGPFALDENYCCYPMMMPAAASLPGKPRIEPWREDKFLRELKDEELIEIEDGIIQPGAKYMKRLGLNHFQRSLMQIKASDVVELDDEGAAAAAKKRRF